MDIVRYKELLNYKKELENYNNFIMCKYGASYPTQYLDNDKSEAVIYKCDHFDIVDDKIQLTYARLVVDTNKNATKVDTFTKTVTFDDIDSFYVVECNKKAPLYSGVILNNGNSGPLYRMDQSPFKAASIFTNFEDAKLAAISATANMKSGYTATIIKIKITDPAKLNDYMLVRHIIEQKNVCALVNKGLLAQLAQGNLPWKFDPNKKYNGLYAAKDTWTVVEQFKYNDIMNTCNN